MNSQPLSASIALLLCAGCSDTSESASSSLEADVSHCDRSCLIDAAHAALEHVAHASDVRLTENGASVELADAWIASASGVHVHNAYADEASHQVMLVGTAQDETAAVFGVRAHIADGQAAELEFLIAHDGEASLFPAEVPIETDDRYDMIVPEADRDSGETMIALANRYFDGIEASGDPELPVAEGCDRVENGMQTTRNPAFGDLRCNSLEPFVYIPTVEQRRFPIVDEARGVVAAIVVFQIPGGDFEIERDGETVMRSYEPRALYLFEAFKVAQGKIQQIEATMRNLPHQAQIGWPLE